MEKDNNKKKIEVCYTCNKEFEMTEDGPNHYHYGKYPMCDYCSEFYGFYKKDRKEE